MSKKSLFIQFILVICILGLFTGCTMNINVGNPTEETTKETNGKTVFDYIFNGEEKPPMYESRATIYISNTVAYTNDDLAISSSDLTAAKSLAETYNVILQSSKIQNQIHKEYPDTDYTLSLEQVNETEIFAIIATGKNPEHLEEICNMAVSLLCENISNILEGVNCKVVDYAKSTQAVGTN